jgi:hypothetical protein
MRALLVTYVVAFLALCGWIAGATRRANHATVTQDHGRRRMYQAIATGSPN